VIHAVGVGMIMPTTMTMVYAVVPRERIGSAMGIFGLAMMVAPAAGPTLGGYLVEYINWRWVFTINLPIGVIGTFLALALLPEFPRNKIGSFDAWGFITSALGLFCMLFALSQGSDWGWTSFRIVMLFYIAFSFLLLFVYHELTTPFPLLELRVFKYATFSIGNMMMMMLNVVMFAGIYYITYYLQTVRGLGAFHAGIIMLPPALVSAFMLPISGRMFDRLGPKIPVGGGLLVLGVMTYFLTKMDVMTPVYHIVIWNMLRCVGIGMAMMPMQTAIMSQLPQSLVGRGSAITNIVSRVSSSLGLAALTVFVTNQMTNHAAYLTWTASGANLSSLLADHQLSASTAAALLQVKISQMAFVQALQELFLIVTICTIIAAIPVVFLKSGQGGHQEAKTEAAENLSET
jgi:EmrB/QacA subfamily drug resistance transporter